jgi:hypothetical protein
MDSGNRRWSMRGRVTACAVALLLVGAAAASAADFATREEMDLVCQNWLSFTVLTRGSWDGEESPHILGVQELSDSEGVLARAYEVWPRGFILVESSRRVHPISAYSEKNGFDFCAPNLSIDSVRTTMRQHADVARSNPNEDARSAWAWLLSDPQVIARSLADVGSRERDEVGPLMTTSWAQGTPYRNECPWGDGGRCVTGCYPTAAGQIMNYHEWPDVGGPDDYEEYLWDGDDSCGGSTASQTLSADMLLDYDWSLMLDDYSPGDTTASARAVAALMYRIGVADHIDYGACTTMSNPSYNPFLWSTTFGYKTVAWHWFTDYTVPDWFAMVREEIDAGCPQMYFIDVGHWTVIDGYRQPGPIQMYVHVNWGTGGPNTGWYAVNSSYAYPVMFYTNIEPDIDTSVPDDVVSGPLLARSTPNPFKNSARITYTVPGTDPVRVSLVIHDVAGRVVRELTDTPQTPGEHTAHWDGADGEGARVASGVYFCRIECAGESSVVKLSLVR